MPSFYFDIEDLIKIAISMGTGALIGFEREYHSKSAGLRTMILICLGSTLFTLISIKLGNDPARIAANIVTGIGFIGGGIIFRDSTNSRISGITTAAAVWVTAALGMCVGFGKNMYGTGFVAMLAVILTLYTLVWVEERIKRNNQNRTYRIVSPFKNDTLHTYEERFQNAGLNARRGVQIKKENTIEGTWHVQGPHKKHEKVIKQLLNDKEILEFEY